MDAKGGGGRGGGGCTFNRLTSHLSHHSLTGGERERERENNKVWANCVRLFFGGGGLYPGSGERGE